MDDRRFDSLTRFLAAKPSRRRLLKGLAAGALAAVVPARAMAGGKSSCAHLCKQLYPPGPERGRCTSLGARGLGPCHCDPSALCGDACCGAGEICEAGLCRPAPCTRCDYTCRPVGTPGYQRCVRTCDECPEPVEGCRLNHCIGAQSCRDDAGGVCPGGGSQDA